MEAIRSHDLNPHDLEPRVRARAIVAAGVLVGGFLSAAEATVVATAAPTIVQQLGGLSGYHWLFASYAFALTCSTLVWGKAADVYARRALYALAVCTFLAGSLLCATAASTPWLLAARVMQGIGGGGMQAVGTTLLGTLYADNERGRIYSYNALVFGTASIAGPLIGGYVVEWASWRWLFWGNVPLGLLVLLIVGLDARQRTAGARSMDATGAVLMSLAILASLISLDATASPDGMGIGGLPTAAWYGIALCGWSAFLWVERRAKEPIVPLWLLGHRQVAPVTACGFLAGASMGGVLAFTPLLVQQVMGQSVLAGGRALTPLLLAWILSASVAGRLSQRYGYVGFVRGGLIVVTLALGGLSTVDGATPTVMLYLILAAVGVGIGASMLGLLLAMQAAVNQDSLGVATALSQFSRNMGGPVGIAAMGIVMTWSLPAGAEGSPIAMAGPLQRAFLLSAVVAAGASLAAFRVRSGDPVSDVVSAREVPQQAQAGS